MGAANIICMVIYIIVAMIMIGIGISQLKSQTPVGFYSGEQPPRENELSDVHAWNKKTWNYVVNLWLDYYDFLCNRLSHWQQ